MPAQWLCGEAFAGRAAVAGRVMQQEWSGTAKANAGDNEKIVITSRRMPVPVLRFISK